MKPNPLASLNHFTVPYCIAMLTSSWMVCVRRVAPRAHCPSMQKARPALQSPGEQCGQQARDAGGGRGDIGQYVVQGNDLVRIRTGTGGPVGDDGQAGVVQAEFAG